MMEAGPHPGQIGALYRYCNHCGSEFFSARDWIAHAIKIAKGFGHKDATWVRNMTGHEREVLGDEEYERILAVAFP